MPFRSIIRVHDRELGEKVDRIRAAWTAGHLTDSEEVALIEQATLVRDALVRRAHLSPWLHTVG